jgi:glycosyltransferase involved in cell wall biosynthesis
VTDNTVSVVIPCYNYGRHLSEAIDSALAQEGAWIEVAVVDDGSTDDTAAVASRYGNRISYVHRRNGGPAAARNTGLALVTGDFVTFLDADDSLAPDFVSECLKALAAHPEAVFAFTQLQKFGRGEGVTKFPPYESATPLRRRVPVCALFRRQALENVRYDERLRSGLEDLDLYLTLAERGATGVLVDRPLVYYRQHEQQGSITDRLLASPVRRWWLHTKLMLRHRASFSLHDWVTFSYELAHDTAHGMKVRRRARRSAREVRP